MSDKIYIRILLATIMILGFALGWNHKSNEKKNKQIINYEKQLYSQDKLIDRIHRLEDKLDNYDIRVGDAKKATTQLLNDVKNIQGE